MQSMKRLMVHLKEYLAFDSPFFGWLTGTIGYVGFLVLVALRQRHRAFRLLTKLHRGNYARIANRKAELIAARVAEQAAGKTGQWAHLCREHVERIAPRPASAQFFEMPERVLGKVAIVLKAAARGEKGVLLLKYPVTFQLLPKRFDVALIGSRYHIVLEPAWSGYCDLDILLYCQYRFPVFVEAFEPRDANFLSRTRSNLVPVPIASNWWVDHRLFKPIAGIKKDCDIVMVAAWGPYKRHDRLFQALGHLRQRGHRLRALLLGYPNGYSSDDISAQAACYGVTDQLELHEWVPYEQVNAHLNRAKVNLLWSRREGVNRAIIEGMFAGVPCIVRKGFNYGFHYPYINESTGRFASEQELPDTLLRMIETYQTFATQQWVHANMTCHKAAQILDNAIGSVAARNNEAWTTGVATKVNKLHGMEYWNPADGKRFQEDYEFLHSAMRPATSG